MPQSTFVEIPPEEQAQMLAALRRARYGYLLALHILLCARLDAPRPTSPRSCSARAPVCTAPCAPIGRAPSGWEHDDDGQLVPPVRTHRPARRRCGERCWPCSRRPRGRMGGAARAGAVPRWP